MKTKFFAIDEFGEKKQLDTNQVIVEFSNGLCLDIDGMSTNEGSVLISAQNILEETSPSAASLSIRPNSSQSIEITPYINDLI